MKDKLTRAQHYRQLAQQFRLAAGDEEADETRRSFTELAQQYQKLADKLVPPL